MRCFLPEIVGMVLLAAAPVGAQAPSSSVAAPQSVPAIINLDRVSDDYRVGPGDVLDIQVIGHVDLSQQSVRVSSVGEMSLATMGILKVGGLTIFEIEDALAARLREKGLVLEAEVLASVTEFQAKPVYVWGAVAHPGEFTMSQDLTIVEAILMAGGLQFNAGDEAWIQRRTTAFGGPPAGGSGEPEVIKVDLRPLKEGRFPAGTLQLRAGDVVSVPEQRLLPFYVVGEVLEPRNFFYLPGQTLTVSQAISWAQGPTMTAKLSEGILVRYDESGTRRELKVDFSAILSGKQPDFPIQPHDIVFIPGSKIKSIATGLVRITDSMVMYGAFRVGRTYQLPGPGEGRARVGDIQGDRNQP